MKIFAIKIILTTFVFFNACAMDGSNVLGLTTKNPRVRSAAQEHNKQTRLLSLPQELFNHTLDFFVDPQQSLEQSIKSSLSLSATCTHFNNLLPHLGTLHQKYPADQRNATMGELQCNINDFTYCDKRRALSLLIHAKAKHNMRPDYSLLMRIVHSDDVEMANILFQHGAQANEIYDNDPIFFRIKSEPMAELFTQYEANWQLTIPANIPPYNGYSILHYKANKNNLEEDIGMVNYLLTIIPKNMINALNARGETPLDCAKKSLYKETSTMSDFLRKHGAMTSQELKEAASSCSQRSDQPEENSMVRKKDTKMGQ